jgi:hypothetical protein
MQLVGPGLARFDAGNLARFRVCKCSCSLGDVICRELAVATINFDGAATLSTFSTV